MTADNLLRPFIDKLFKARQKEWAKQGRSPDQQWAVENFRSGQGDLFIDDLVGLVRNERKAAAEDFKDRIFEYLCANDTPKRGEIHRAMLQFLDS